MKFQKMMISSRTQNKKINKLCWEAFDSIKKLLSLFTKWQVIHFKSMWLMPYMISDKDLNILRGKINQLSNKEISMQILRKYL